ncbi:hypothetical protein DICPUDRAFT_156089 [Dictyostelium purpureum]|uniref:Uncharacterized protein n=1 Tax=Dictyostelium purpureum TaxID=5786 RepID=F0ZVP1_DICPU|nr:uncharacterized protein DICPUDRAFT_156089 [Dictyostelium purpureum]EGC31981.1 hypothetical protein DICPUDRAFT_156089 [Dictyostelium purpureum]|eukprot:XP_003291479.1 hypothetical protein DICPUDRAFT_156089 [Dictyostelium purpureum]
MALNSSTIHSLESLTVRFGYDSFRVYFNDDSNRNDNEDHQLNQLKPSKYCEYDFSKLVEFSIKISSLSTINKSLKRLVIRKCLDDHIGESPSNDRPGLLINQLIHNSTLKTLGLEFYDIRNCSELSQLTQIPNITTLYCSPKSIKYFLQHCINNPHIKKLVVGNEQEYNVDTELYETFSNFFLNNHSLKTLVLLEYIHYFFTKTF